MTHVNRIKAELKFNTIYVCSKCGAQAVGTTVTTSFDGCSSATTDDLKSYITNYPQRAGQMPVGWGSYGGSDFRCPEHT
jgi:DNA-directed RNA polymerase subunit RPC12/RpoP